MARGLAIADSEDQWNDEDHMHCGQSRDICVDGAYKEHQQ